MRLQRRLHWWLHHLCDRVARAAAQRPSLLRWQRERFFANAARFVPVIGVDDHLGNRYYVRTDDPWIGRVLFLNGSYEATKVGSALAVLADAGISTNQLLDVGANIGVTTIEFLSRVPGASSVAFEPEAVNLALLAQNLLANALEDRVTTHPLAVSDRDGTVELEIALDPGDHRVRLAELEPGQLGERDRPVRLVEARRLDTLIERGDVVIDPHTLAWMDVQGHEDHVLAGATKLMDARVPIAFEFWPYALRRAGRLEQLIVRVTAYGTLWDIGGDRPRALGASELAARAADLSPAAAHELLVVPNRTV